MSRRIAICVATYRRTAMLARLLESLVDDRRLAGPRDDTIELRVVDNDAEGSAREVVEAFAGRVADPVRYAIAAERNIAVARNAGVTMGPADLYAFVDDDEVADPGWLAELVGTLDRGDGLDAVFGPVRGELPADGPRWMRGSTWFDKPVAAEGETIDWTATRTSNTLVIGRWFDQLGLRFDASYGRSGGSDTALFAEIGRHGGRFGAAPRAGVWEDVEPDRMSLAWLTRRRFRGGIVYHRIETTNGTARPLTDVTRRTAKALITAIAGLPAACLSRPRLLVDALLTAGLAAGGVYAWLRPEGGRTFVEYTTRKQAVLA